MNSQFYVAVGVSCLLILHLWYGGMRSINHNVCVCVLQEVPHIMVKQTILVHLKCWPLWDVDNKLISILAVVGHKVIFLYQSKGQDVSYYLGVIPDRIIITMEIANYFGVCHSCVTMDNIYVSIVTQE